MLNMPSLLNETLLRGLGLGGWDISSAGLIRLGRVTLAVGIADLEP